MLSSFYSVFYLMFSFKVIMNNSCSFILPTFTLYHQKTYFEEKSHGSAFSTLPTKLYGMSIHDNATVKRYTIRLQFNKTIRQDYIFRQVESL